MTTALYTIQTAPDFSHRYEDSNIVANPQKSLKTKETNSR
jgi:hypothetical protein